MNRRPITMDALIGYGVPTIAFELIRILAIGEEPK